MPHITRIASLTGVASSAGASGNGGKMPLGRPVVPDE